jgi:hypothetical protein
MEVEGENWMDEALMEELFQAAEEDPMDRRFTPEELMPIRPVEENIEAVLREHPLMMETDEEVEHGHHRDARDLGHPPRDAPPGELSAVMALNCCHCRGVGWRKFELVADLSDGRAAFFARNGSKETPTLPAQEVVEILEETLLISPSAEPALADLFCRIDERLRDTSPRTPPRGGRP